MCGKDGYPRGCAYTNWHNFSPRVGLAWSLDPKTVIRVGGGLYYGTQDGNTLLKLAQTLPTTYAQTLTFNAYVPQNPGFNVFTSAIVGSQAIQAAALDPHQGTPYSPQWSFNMQRSLAPQTMLEIGYLGTAGVHLEQNVQVNNSMPGTAVKRPILRLDAGAGGAVGAGVPLSTTTVPVTTINYFPHSAHSNYHALTARGERRFTQRVFAAQLIHLVESDLQRAAIPQRGRHHRRRKFAAAEFLRSGGRPQSRVLQRQIPLGDHLSLRSAVRQEPPYVESRRRRGPGGRLATLRHFATADRVPVHHQLQGRHD